MNARIKELAEQVHVTSESYGLKGEPKHLWYDFRDDALEKFFKLVVADCCQHLTDVGQDHAREQLEKHFSIGNDIQIR